MAESKIRQKQSRETEFEASTCTRSQERGENAKDKNSSFRFHVLIGWKSGASSLNQYGV